MLKLLAALFAGALATASHFALAQPYPAKPVRVIVPFAPGGGSNAGGNLAPKPRCALPRTATLCS